MDLSSLNFKVNTKELQDAFTTLQQLKGAVDGLSTPMQNLAKNSGKVTKEVNETEKATKRNTKAQDEAAEKASKASSILEKQVRTLSIFRNETQKVADGSVKLGDAFTKSQAGMLAMMQMAGATSTEMQQLSKVFVDYNKITGLNTFDKSAQALAKLKKEMKETNQVASLQAQGIALTRDEYVGLARDLERVKQAMRAEGASARETASAMRELKQEFIATANARNQQMAGVTAAEKQAKETANRMQRELTMMDQAVVKFRESEMQKAREYKKRLDAEATAMNQSVALFRANEQKKADAARKTADAIELQAKRAELAQKYLAEGFTIGQANRGARLESGGASESMVRSILKQDQANREAARSTREFANAVQFLADEERKADAVLAEVTGQTNRQQLASERTASKVAAYGRALEKSGVDAATAAKRMDIYKAKLMQIEKIETERRSAFLSRALAPQISDVVVSLGSGQNPLTVLLQQGLQVRDLIGQSGVAVQDLQRTFKTAAADMVSSLKGTAVAIGSLLVGTLADLGKASTKWLFDSSKSLLQSIKFGTLYLFGFQENTDNLKKSVSALGDAVAAVGRIGPAALGAVAIAMGVALYQVIKQENELARALALSGGSLGLSQARAIEYAKSLNELGISTNDAIKVMIEMAKQGGFVSADFERVTKAAVDLKTYGGVAIEDTVKSFAKMKKEPVEALIELAKKTGMVDVETIKLVRSLAEQGKTADATKIAMQALADVNASQVDRMKSDLNGFSIAVIEMGKSLANFFDGVFRDLFRKDAPIAALEKQLKAVQEIRAGEGLLNFGGGVLGLGKDYYAQMEVDLQKQIMRLKDVAMLDEQRSVQRVKDASMQEEASKFLDTYTTKEIEKKKELIKLEKLRSAMTVEQYEMAKKAIEERFKEKVTPKTEGERFFDKAMRDFTNNSIAAAFAQDELSKSQLKILQIVEDPRWLKLKKTEKESILNTFAEAFAHEQLAKEIEDENKKREAAVELRNKAVEIFGKELEKQKELDSSMKEATLELESQYALLGLTNEERQKEILLRQEAVKYRKELAEIDKSENSEENKVLFRQQALARYEIAVRNVNRKIAIDAAFQMQTSLSDAIETALFEGGRAGSKKLRDIITAELRKPIRVFIEAVVGNVIGGIFGGSGGSSGVESTGAGSLGSLSNLLSSGKKVVDLLTGGVRSNISGLVTKNLQYAADYLATSSNNVLATIGDKLGGYTNQIGSFAGVVGSALAGIGVYNALSGGYSISKGVDIIGKAAALYFGPIGGAVGGLVNRAFGRKAPVTTGSGIEGTFSTTGANVNQYTETFQKGGWFRSNKVRRYTSAISSEMDRFLDESLMQITATTKAYASILGLVPEAIDGVTQGVNISLMGLSAEGQQTAITNALGGFGDRLAQQLLGTFSTVYDAVLGRKNRIIGYTAREVWNPGEFVRDGETAGQALTRLATSLTTVNATFDTLNQTLLATSLIGGDTASKLLDAFGGTEAFTRLTTDYYQNYYTEQERVATTTRQLTTIFGNMGYTLPKTREEFRALVESQNLYTESGRSTYAALLNLAPAFATITDAVEQFTSSLIDEVRRLRGEIASSSTDNGLEFFKAQFSAANTAALAGDTTALQQLPELSRMVEEAAKAQANSSADIVRIQAWLAQSLSTTSGALGQQVPQFATGGMHTGGARIVGENGPELEITGPSRIMNASQTASILNGSTAELLRALNDNISGLRAEVRADVTHNAKVAKLLDRVIPEGDSIQISGTIDGGTV